MILEDLRALREGRVLNADVCIIGAGPAGLTIARELSASSFDVVLLESGLRTGKPWIDALGEIESIGAPRVLDQTKVRNRVLGGSSATWSGRAATFDPLDFSARDWVDHSGWPISRESLAGYFGRSMPYLGLAVADNVAHPPVVATDNLATEELSPYLWSYSADESDSRDFMRFGSTSFARDHKADRVTGYLGATVTHIDTTERGDAVTGLEVRGLDGLIRRVEARIVILCAGGIENARLLLASNRIVPGGVGNTHDLVGRYLADHPRGAVGYFDTAEAAPIQQLFAGHQVRVGGRRVTLTSGLALSPIVQRRERLLNCSMWISGERHPDDPISSALDLLRRRGAPVANLRNIVRGARGLVRGAYSALVKRRSPVRLVKELSLQIMVEQQPDPDSRVTLADRCDAFGMPLARIDWRIGEAEARTVRRAAVLFVDRLRQLGLPEPRLDEMITDPSRPFLLPDVAHPSGTTRMSRDPVNGVVDENCRVHGVAGLYIAGSSVFPTNGHANPTQMIVALAIRLADEITRQNGRAA